MAEKDHATPILDAIAAGERYAHGAYTDDGDDDDGDGEQQSCLPAGV